MSAHAAAAAAPGVGHLLAYGALSLPLAFAALPLYVHVPKLYGGHLGIALGTVGAVLLAARLLDAVADPLLGAVSDRLQRRRALTLAALPLLAAGMFGLLRPPDGAGAGWLVAMLAVAYTGYSLASVNYCAWGAEAGHDSASRTALTAAREGCALLGVIVAAALPALLAADLPSGLAQLAWVFLPLLAGCAAATLYLAPAPQQRAATQSLRAADLLAPLGDGRFLRLLAVFAANGVAAAIPATIVLFFVADVLQAERLSGLFLVAYFAAGAAALPLWVAAGRRWGRVRAWGASMLLASAAFVWAASLGAGDVMPFLIICVLSGLALGADITFPPALLADALAGPRRAHAAGTYFGWWNLVTKLNLALAAGVALPVLDALGFESGARDPASLQALAVVYALVPIVLKALAGLLLWRLGAAIDVREESA